MKLHKMKCSIPRNLAWENEKKTSFMPIRAGDGGEADPRGKPFPPGISTAPAPMSAGTRKAGKTDTTRKTSGYYA